MNCPETVRRCFDGEQVYYSGHARREMREEELGPITDREVHEAMLSTQVVEEYPEDTPYPSALLFGSSAAGHSAAGRPLHAVCAYDAADDRVIIVTVYEPDPAKWENYRRRKG
jgi:hypothetical protein